jgi:hypothetical protein
MGQVSNFPILGMIFDKKGIEMSVNIDKTTMERLTFIKYLYNTAVDQSGKPEPQCSLSLLAFHDSVEFFLQLTAMYLGVNKKAPNFMDYWGLIDTAPGKKGTPLNQKESMRRLEARGQLKHQGIRPSKLDIEGYREDVKNFFMQNTKLVFDLEFAKLSLIDLVQFDRVRDRLNEAQKALDKDMIKIALADVAIAFKLLIGEYESTKTRRFGLSPFFPGKSFQHINGKDIFREGYNNTFFNSVSDIGKHTLDKSVNVKKLVDFIDSVSESMESIQNTLKLISLGIDYRKYVKFRLYIPAILWSMGEPIIQERDWGSRGLPKIEDVSFCINFVIEFAIALQEFDFVIERD